MLEPDIIVVCRPEKLLKKRVFGAPDFAAGILPPSGRKHDMGIRLWKYQHAGVREYWMIDPAEELRILPEEKDPT